MKHIHCPVNGWDCPYFRNEDHPCRCILPDPINNCDDFATMWDAIEDDGDWIDDDWEGACLTCGNAEQDTTDKVACCNCCETAEFYYRNPEL